nr:ABC transporter ATP-binding protein [Maliibacterium massiliense]
MAHNKRRGPHDGSLRALLAGQYGWFTLALASSVLASLFALVLPLAIRNIVDSVIGTLPLEAPGWVQALFAQVGGRDVLVRQLWICALAVLAVALLNALFSFLRTFAAQAGSEGFVRTLRDRLLAHLQRLPFGYHVRAEAGEIIQRCTTDADILRKFVSTQIPEMARAVSLIALSLALMLSISAPMTLVTMSLVPLVAVISLIYFAVVQKRFRMADEAEGMMSTTLQENLSGVRVVRAFGRQRYELDKYTARNQEATRLANRVNNAMALYWGMTDAMGYIQVGLALVAGTYQCVQGALSVGELIVFVTYANMLVWPVRQMGRMLADFGKARVSWERLRDILVQTPEDDAGTREVPRGDIVLQNVTFGYEPDHPVLRDISFTVPEGATVAILGSTGAGKSTLVHLLDRLYDYQAGSITLGGVELNTIARSALRKKVGLILQEPFLYARSLRDNIALTCPDAPAQQVHEAARVAALHNVARSFAKGYDTMVGERGITLSGGQKQRVAIARTLMRRTPILIFDDSLSAVDTRTDAAIRRALAKRGGKRTTIIISHRITTLLEADWVVVLDKGRVAQQGTCDDLIKQGGLFHDIYQVQSALKEDVRRGADA